MTTSRKINEIIKLINKYFDDKGYLTIEKLIDGLDY